MRRVSAPSCRHPYVAGQTVLILSFRGRFLLAFLGISAFAVLAARRGDVGIS